MMISIFFYLFFHSMNKNIINILPNIELHNDIKKVKMTLKWQCFVKYLGNSNGGVNQCCFSLGRKS